VAAIRASGALPDGSALNDVIPASVFGRLSYPGNTVGDRLIGPVRGLIQDFEEAGIAVLADIGETTLLRRSEVGQQLIPGIVVIRPPAPATEEHRLVHTLDIAIGQIDIGGPVHFLNLQGQTDGGQIRLVKLRDRALDR